MTITKLVKKIIDRLGYYFYRFNKNRALNVTSNYEDIINQGFYSQEGQDLFLNKLLGINNGYFIDIGASDGLQINNSYYFEQMGWKGIAIEPNPSQYKKLVSNRNCKCVNSCIGLESNKKIFLQIDGYAQDYSGLLDNYNLTHLKKVHYHIHHYGGKINYIELPITNFMNVIESTNIDILFIDTEGSELQILESINFGHVEIKIICVENFYNDYRIYHLLKNNNYKMIARTTHDEIYSNIYN